ncbi:MAG: heme exporter protein CcmD [Proteobacteria bacterium]|nr:heme exporter protein CcmD [Pseudomonadota bacterium]
MMVELGKYAGTVLGAYGVSIALLLGLIGMSFRSSARIRRQLEAQEKRMGRHG